MVWEWKIKLVRDEIREEGKAGGETLDGSTRPLIIVYFGGGSEWVRTIIDGYTDLG